VTATGVKNLDRPTGSRVAAAVPDMSGNGLCGYVKTADERNYAERARDNGLHVFLP
jgi:hypothetical protein